jgi:hypothetical protein
MFNGIANCCYSFFCGCKKWKDDEQFELESEEDSPRNDYIFDEAAKKDIDELSYDNLFTKVHRVYEVIIYLNDCYMHLTKKTRHTGDQKDTTGWKIHLSLENEEENLKKGWNVVMPLLIQYGVYQSKVVQSRFLNDIQLGKEIVIYECNAKNNLDWNILLNEIETALEKNGVKQGKNPKFRFGEEMTNIPEIKISGSNYFYCANDAKNVKVTYNDGDSPFKAVSLNKEKLEILKI